MHPRLRRLASLLPICILFGAGCARVAGEEEATDEPARIENVKGTHDKRLVLEARAAKRLGITTAPVREAAGATGEVIAYSALIYDPEGDAFVYTNPKPLQFIRRPVTVDRIEGDEVFLSAGPPAGTAVVTVGTPELFGVEFGIGEFE